MSGAASLSMFRQRTAELVTDARQAPGSAPAASHDALTEGALTDDAIADDALMCAVQQGRLEALATLFDRHHGPLLNYFLRTGGGGAGEDLVQDLFVRMLKYRATYRPGSRFVTWMYSIARNVRLDGAHKRRGEVAWEDSFAPPVQPGDPAQSAQEHRLLAQALQRLAPEKREILVLARFQELKYEAIGAILGCQPGAVKVRVHRALRELRQQYLALTQANNPGGNP